MSRNAASSGLCNVVTETSSFVRMKNQSHTFSFVPVELLTKTQQNELIWCSHRTQFGRYDWNDGNIMSLERNFNSFE